MENEEIKNEEKMEPSKTPEGKQKKESPKNKSKISRIIMWLLLFIAILFFIFILLIGFIGYALLSKTSEMPTTGAQEIQEQHSAYFGTITGSLGYPSEFIPPLVVCAQNTKTKEEFCTYENIEGSEFIYGIGYTLEVPAGTYNIYAQPIDNEASGEDFKGYYSKYVTCGMDIDCESHKEIDVKVVGGETTSDVDPIDWYNN